MRSRLPDSMSADVATGIISACAEQTLWQRSVTRSTWDHLRVCGADLVWFWLMARDWGSSPRVRSRPEFNNAQILNMRIISACAEQTSNANHWTVL